MAELAEANSGEHKGARDSAAGSCSRRCASRSPAARHARAGAASLQEIFERGGEVPLANDTSFGVGFAPFSPVGLTVLEAGRQLASPELRAAFPCADDDSRVMAPRPLALPEAVWINPPHETVLEVSPASEISTRPEAQVPPCRRIASGYSTHRSEVGAMT
jgi:hypothetical protein